MTRTISKRVIYSRRGWRRCCSIFHHMRSLVRWSIKLRRKRHPFRRQPRRTEGWRSSHRHRERTVVHRVPPVRGGQHHHGEKHRRRPARRRGGLRRGQSSLASAIGLRPQELLLRKQGALEACDHKGFCLRFPGAAHWRSCTHTSKPHFGNIVS